MSQPWLLIIGALPKPIGGVSIHAKRLSYQLTQRNIQHTVLNESRSPSEGALDYRRMTFWDYLATLRRYECVHIHSSSHSRRLFHTVFARLLGLKVIQTVHSSHGGWPVLTALRIACRLGHVCIGVSRAVASKMGKSTHVIPAFIRPSLSEEEIPGSVVDWMTQKSKEEKTIVAMNAYRPSRMNGVDLYGIDMMIEAFRDERIQADFAAIICVAHLELDQEYWSHLMESSRDLVDDGRVLFYTDEIAFSGVVKRSDIFVRPTITDGDALSIREAIWYGVPAIASDAAVRPEGTIVFRTRDAGEFADRIISASQVEERIVVQKDFTDDLLEIYDQMQH